jgi:hypothetical protein
MDARQNKLRIRPRFKEIVKVAPDQIKTQIKEHLSKHTDQCKGDIIDHHVILRIPKKDQHYWSPQLSLELEAIEEGTLIRGLFGPKPGVWTMFVFFYSALGFLTLLGLLFGLSQMMLKMDAYGLWAVPVGLFLLIGLFIMSKIGQNLGKQQMHQLHDFLDEAVGISSMS